MITKIKEKLVKWSRHAEFITKISRIFTVIILSFFIPIVLWDIGLRIISESVYAFLWGIFGATLVAGIIVILIKDVLNAIKINEEYVYKNKLLYVLLSDKDVVWITLFISFIIISLIFGFNFWIYLLWIILLSIFENKIANYFKAKLSK